MHHYILETDRLILRPLTAADAPAVFVWGGDPEVNRYMSYPLERSVADAEKWLRTVEESRPEDGYDFGFVRKEDGALIGSGGTYPRADGRTWTFGYNLRRDCWGRGMPPRQPGAILPLPRRHWGHGYSRRSTPWTTPPPGRVMEKCGMSSTISGNIPSWTARDLSGKMLPAGAGSAQPGAQGAAGGGTISALPPHILRITSTYRR